MPASLFEAFNSPHGTEQTAPSNEPEKNLDYNSVLSPFFPKSAVSTAPYSMPTLPEKMDPVDKSLPDLPASTGRDLLPLYTGPAAPPMRHHDCHDQIASILSCRVCREKLKLILNDDFLTQSGGGNNSNVLSSLSEGISTLTKNTDFVNLFLIVGMILIIHKLFRK